MITEEELDIELEEIAVISEDNPHLLTIKISKLEHLVYVPKILVVFFRTAPFSYLEIIYNPKLDLNSNTEIMKYDAAMKHLSEILEAATKCGLESLSLKNLPIGSKVGAHSLSKWLQTNNKLTSLDITNTGLCDDGAVAVLDGLSQNTTLQELRLGNNGFCRRTTFNFHRLFQHNFSLQLLDIDLGHRTHNGQASDKVNKGFDKMLERNKALSQLKTSQSFCQCLKMFGFSKEITSIMLDYFFSLTENDKKVILNDIFPGSESKEKSEQHFAVRIQELRSLCISPRSDTLAAAGDSIPTLRLSSIPKIVCQSNKTTSLSAEESPLLESTQKVGSAYGHDRHDGLDGRVKRNSIGKSA